MKAHEIISEIQKLNVSAREFEHEFDRVPPSAKWQELPGGLGLTWTSYKSQHYLHIWIAQSTVGQEFVPPKKQRFEFFDEYQARVAAAKKQWRQGQKIVGQLELSASSRYSFLPDAFQVGIIFVDPQARGKGIAKSLYGIALYTLKLTLVAGSSQTQGGRRNWTSLSQIPGVEVKGIVVVDDYELGPVSAEHARRYLAKDKRKADTIIDTIMQLGGDYLGDNLHGDHCFAFDVVPGTGDLAPAVKTTMNKIYTNSGASYKGNDLFARWVG